MNREAILFTERDADEHRRMSGNFESHLSALAHQHIERGEVGPAGILLVLERQIKNAHTDYRLAVAYLLPPPADTPDEPKKAPAPPAARGPRHRFVEQPDGRLVCLERHAGAESICGKVKSKGGRPPAAPPAPPRDPAARTVPLPMGDAAADRYADGGQGSSGREQRGKA